MIGVDRMADLVDSAMRSEADRGYPPYDVEKTGADGYRITLAAAGFGAQVDYIYEQSPAELFANLLPRYVSTQLYRAMLESEAAEDAERRRQLLLAVQPLVVGRALGGRSVGDAR